MYQLAALVRPGAQSWRPSTGLPLEGLPGGVEIRVECKVPSTDDSTESTRTVSRTSSKEQ